MNEPVSPREAAQQAGVSYETVRRAIKAGELAAVRHTHGRREYRISRAALAAWIAARNEVVTVEGERGVAAQRQKGQQG